MVLGRLVNKYKPRDPHDKYRPQNSPTHNEISKPSTTPLYKSTMDKIHTYSEKMHSTGKNIWPYTPIETGIIVASVLIIHTSIESFTKEETTLGAFIDDKITAVQEGPRVLEEINEYEFSQDSS